MKLALGVLAVAATVGITAYGIVRWTLRGAEGWIIAERNGAPHVVERSR